MKVQELLMNIHNKEFNLERGLRVKKYLPIEAKKAIAQAIIYESVDEEDGIVKVDSVQRYLSYVKHMIVSHTNLEYTDEDYDILCSTEYGESTLLNEIVETFQGDANECNRILGMMVEDYLTNNDPENKIVGVANSFLNTLIDLAHTLEDKVQGFDLGSMIPEDLDMAKLTSFLNDNYKK